MGRRTKRRVTNSTRETTTKTDIDFYAHAGQSNAGGRGDATQSPDLSPGTAIEYRNKSASFADPLDDPVQGGVWNGTWFGAETGSAWPSFFKDYYAHTERKACLVGTAVGGSAEHRDAEYHAGKHWDDGGDLYPMSVNQIHEAMTALETDGYNPQFRGILWSQGERDATEITDGNLTKSQYKSAFETMLSKFRTEFRSSLPFFLFQTGTRKSGDTTGMQRVRAAQDEVVTSDPYTYMVSDKQKDLPYNNDLHYTQDGYNTMGEVGALNVARLVHGSTFRARYGTTA
ncbi:sialate O-acetylesterase (plasmid) [Haladaptatus sp. SPP-AMP-3]|uniref:sialate O-acetylesterase n=1 Tax=Haladaptatus sp. SPP-AMP-3 TaxID=3121295 RepID=UPI003C2E1474